MDNYPAVLEYAADRLGIDKLRAGVVIDWILARAKSEPKSLRRYIASSLTRDWAEWERYTQTGQLPE